MNSRKISYSCATKTDKHKRLKRKLYDLSDEKLIEIKDKLKTFSKNSKPHQLAGFLGAFRHFMLLV